MSSEPAPPRCADKGSGLARAAVLATWLAVFGLGGGAEAAVEGAFGAIDGRDCTHCYALIMVPETMPEGEADALAGALARNGFDVTNHRTGGLIAAEAAAIRFFRKASKTSGSRILVYSALDLVARPYGDALATAETARSAARNERLDALPLGGLRDMAQDAAPTSAVILLDVDRAPSVSRPMSGAGAGVEPSIIHGGGAEQLDSFLREMLETGGRGASFARGGGLLTVEEARRIIERESEEPSAPSDGLEAALSPIAGMRQSAMRAARSELEADISLPGLERFVQQYCAGGDASADCLWAVSQEAALRAEMKEDERLCHALAAHPDDEEAKAGGVAFNQMTERDARRAQGACLSALDANPNDPLLSYQLGRALERLGNAQPARRNYEAAAKAGHRHALFNLAMLLNDMGERRDAVETLKRAAESGLVQAIVELGRWRNDGTETGRRDRDGAIALLREVRDDLAAAFVLAEILAEPSADASELRQAAELYDYVASKLPPQQSAALRARALAVEDRLETLEQAATAERQSEAINRCRRIVRYRPMDVLGLRTMVRQSENFAQRQARDLLERVDLDDAIAACDEVMNTDDAPADLLGRYGYLLSRADLLGRPYRGARSGWLPLIRRAADAGDPDALVLLGNYFVLNASDENPVDFRAGLDFLERGRSDRPEATLILALTHLNFIKQGGLMRWKDPDRGLSFINRKEIDRFPLTHVARMAVYAQPQPRGLPARFQDRTAANEHFLRAQESGWIFDRKGN